MPRALYYYEFFQKTLRDSAKRLQQSYPSAITGVALLHIHDRRWLELLAKFAKLQLSAAVRLGLAAIDGEMRRFRRYLRS